ncbi:MAG: antitoxin MazE family protein [Acidobacteria bacterium]|nr:antitoxin MazE family protein [Acidobacteriota bacterium]
MDKARAYRERMRARGFRPIQIWVPDTRTADFRAEAHHQSRAVAHSARERGDQAFIDAISDRGAE